MRKYRVPLNDSEIALLQELATIDPTQWTEEDVREEFITPLLRLLGYKKGTTYTVSRAESHSIRYLMIGRQRIQIDYVCHVRREKLWIIEAKPGNSDISEEDVLQANYYALHPEIDASYFLVTNAREILLFERDNRKENGEANLRLTVSDLSDERNFYLLDSYIGASQIVPTLKSRLLDKTAKVLSSEIAIDRLEEFQNEVNRVIHRVRTTVLQNFRNAAKVKQENEVKEFKRLLTERYSNRPYHAADDLLLFNMTVGRMEAVAEFLHTSVERFPQKSSVQELFYHTVLSNDDYRLRNIVFYWNQVVFLFHAFDHSMTSIAGRDVKKEIDEKLGMALNHFKTDVKYRYLWAFEGLLGRLGKLIVILPDEVTKKIQKGVVDLRYILDEEDVAWLHPHPAQLVIETIEEIILIGLGRIISSYWNPNKRALYVIKKRKLSTSSSRGEVVDNLATVP